MPAAAESTVRFTKEYLLTVCPSTGTSVRTCLLLILSPLLIIFNPPPPPTQRGSKGKHGSDNVTGKIVKANVGDSEKDTRGKFKKCHGKELTGVVVRVVGHKRYFVRF